MLVTIVDASAFLSESHAFAFALGWEILCGASEALVKEMGEHGVGDRD